MKKGFYITAIVVLIHSAFIYGRASSPCSRMAGYWISPTYPECEEFISIAEDGTNYTGSYHLLLRGGGTFIVPCNDSVLKITPTVLISYLQNEDKLICMNDTFIRKKNPSERKFVQKVEADGKYEGEINGEGIKEGIGKKSYKYGVTYSGEWKYNLENGFGSLEYNSAERYFKIDAMFSDGHPNGEGAAVIKDKGYIIEFKGEFKNGQYYNGVSVTSKPDGKKETSEWKNGVKAN